MFVKTKNKQKMIKIFRFPIYLFAEIVYNSEYMGVSFTTKKIAVLALFTALGLITFIIENQFPPMFIPGAKMGLSNIFSFAALIMYSPVEGFIVIIARTVLGAMFVGNFSTVIYSFTAGMVSMAVSSLLLYVLFPKISIMAISIAAAVCHNVVQDLVFCLLAGTTYALYYMPYLMLLGVLAGAIVGAATLLIFKKVPLSVFEKSIYKRKKG